jgi:hypothetical protein
MPLDSLDKIQLQKWLNEMAEKYSKGLVLHSKFYLKSILSEAQEQDYILKSPANKLESPSWNPVERSRLRTTL